MIKRAVILAAGKGTRMQAVARGVSKEMLLLHNKPIIFYSIKEALEAGCTEICIVLNRAKKDLLDYLTEQQMQGIPITFVFREPQGIIDALSATKDFVKYDNFSVILPDMLHFGEQNATRHVCKTCEDFNKHVIALIPEQKKFGTGEYAAVQKINKEVFLVNDITNNPKDNLRFFGRYAFLNSVFSDLERCPHEESEIALLRTFIKQNMLYGCLLDGKMFDAGIPEGYQEAKKALKNYGDNNLKLNKNEHR